MAGIASAKNVEIKRTSLERREYNKWMKKRKSVSSAEKIWMLKTIIRTKMALITRYVKNV